MIDYARIRFVTAHYHDLHGLRWVLWGFVCFAIAAEDFGTIPKWVMLTLILPVGLTGFIGTTWYYLKRFGNVMQPPAKPSMIMSPLFFIALLLLAFALDKAWNVRPFLMPFAFAVWFAASFWLVGPRYRWYYLLLALSICAANIALATVDFPAASPWLRRGVVNWTLVGGAMIIGGLLDHRLLVRTLKPGGTGHE